MLLKSPLARAWASAAALLAIVLGAGWAIATASIAHAAPSGELQWAVNTEFRAYVTRAGGTVTGGGAATEDGTTTRFPLASNNVTAEGTGSVGYEGSVTFTAHGGALSVTIADPAVRFTGPTSAVLEVTSNSSRIAVATLDLTGASVSASGGVVTFGAAPATLTADGVAVFGGSYQEGTALAPVTFSFAAAAPTTTSSSSADPTSSTPDPTPEPQVPTVHVDKVTGLNGDGDTVTVTGTGFLPDANGATTGTRPPLAGKFTGMYVLFAKFGDNWKPSTGGTRPRAAIETQKWAVLAADINTIGGPQAGAIEVKPDGTFTATIAVSDTLTNEGNWGIYTYAAGGPVYAPFETFTPLSFATVDPSPAPEPTVSPEPSTSPEPTTPATPTTPTTVGRLTWGVDSDFRAYVTGPIAQGSISVAGASSNGSTFTFVQSGGSVDLAAGTGRASYAGSVTFTGHGGALSVTLSKPSVRLTGTTTGVLEVTTSAGTVDFATLDLSTASKSQSGDAVRLTGVRTTLTSAGAQAFGGFYDAGRQLDPLTVSFGAGASASASPAKTVTAAYSAPSVPDTPPATTGIVLDDQTLASLVAGDEVTITVGGFAPGETGITVVIYSTPTVLATDLTADAQGTVTWTGRLPQGLSGTHTLVFIGSAAKGVEVTIPAAAPGSCAIASATLDWGFKEAFRAYIESTIAKGGWELAEGAAEEGGIFSFEGAGAVEPSDSSGLVSFSGSVRFTGHEGALDTTIANPQVVFAGAEASLLVDVIGTTQSGEQVSAQGVEFASLDLEQASVTATDGGVVFSDIPATLTEAGSSAFGTYPAGEVLDPVTLTLDGTDECIMTFAGLEQPEASPSAVETTESAPAAPEESDGGIPAWVWIVVAVAALGLAGGLVAVRARRK